jgi:chemotaxis methyl-accepting protein methylase
MSPITFEIENMDDKKFIACRNGLIIFRRKVLQHLLNNFSTVRESTVLSISNITVTYWIPRMRTSM